MKFAHLDEQEYVHLGGHRDGDIQFNRLFTGKVNTPGTYEFNMTYFNGPYYTPRHSHNHDQLRFAWDADYNNSPDQDIPQGWIAYHPESAPYGPQVVENTPKVLSLQFGGPSGVGFMTYDQVDQAGRELRESGRFEDGKYITVDVDGIEHSSDSWEAVFEHATGRKPEYPEARTDRPILFNPHAYKWLPVDGEPGVSRKLLGVLNERELAIGFLAWDKGARHRLAGHKAPVIVFVMSGLLQVGDQELTPNGAVLVEVGDEAELVGSAERTEAYYIELPYFYEAPDAY